MVMSLTWRSRLAVLVSLGPTPASGAPDVDPVEVPGASGTPGALFLAPADPAGPRALPGLLACAGAAARFIVPTALVLAAPPAPHPASNPPDRAARAIRDIARLRGRGDSRWLNVCCMARPPG